jgi:phosphatidylserine decarboxylase
MSAEDSPGVAARLFVALQHVLPQHALSRVVHRLTRVRAPAVKNALIRSFVRNFRPDMTEAAQRDPLSYASFNEFFTRSLRPGTRPVAPDASLVTSPVDGTISQIGYLDGSRLVQAKGHRYTLESLLGAAADDTAARWAQRLTGGTFATLYLAPYNYHRIHMPLSGTLRAAWYVPGRLFSVNTTTAASVPGLFSRNERIVCLFEDAGLVFALVLVGALFVGSMTTIWHGEVTPRSPRRQLELPLVAERGPLALEKGAEMGRFNMGSTVILLLPPGAAAWLPGLQTGGRITVGQPLARLSRQSLSVRA